MPNASSITIKKFDEQYTDMVLKIMETFSDFFSPETINFAKEKLPKLQGFLAFEENMLL
ncbi:MAG: hypothetical protein LBU27_09800 [Candidatus Peribacteria bacterium]|jgi:hypothetical protein|nr:hypothetical protein [Candidatus Peribacteria bacterium]